MTGMRAGLAIATAALSVGCASTGTLTARQLSPQNGPKAKIHATYVGGVTHRSTSATFELDRSAYALVAHLGGDGNIRILYPQDPRETGLLAGGVQYRTPQFSAMYDGAPYLYTYAANSYRSPGAQIDSYDGRGNGFIFIISSSEPFQFDRLTDGPYWDDIPVDNYFTISDPRYAIKEFADNLAGGQLYTLQFANSFGTVAMTSYGDALWDCAMMASSGLNYMGFINPSYAWVFGSFIWAATPTSRCGNYRYAYNDFYTFGFPSRLYVPRPIVNPVTPPQPPTGRPILGPHGLPGISRAILRRQPTTNASTTPTASRPRPLSRPWDTDAPRGGRAPDRSPRPTFSEPTRHVVHSAPRFTPRPAAPAAAPTPAPAPAPAPAPTKHGTAKAQ